MLHDWGTVERGETYQVLSKFIRCDFIVMEKLGMSLKDMLMNVDENFCLVDTLKIGIQLIDLVENLHKIGYIHCDLKPDNILIGDYNRIFKNLLETNSDLD